MEPDGLLPPLPLPAGISSGYFEPPSSELSIHVLEAGQRGQPLILLLHGFPELAFSFRKIMAPLAAAGFYVVAPDARGFGRTRGWDDRAYAEIDLATFSTTNLVRDVVVLVHELGYQKVHCVFGHDCGAQTASLAALIRPDMFERVVVAAHPYDGPPKVSRGDGQSRKAPSRPWSVTHAKSSTSEPISADLAALSPPRKPYKWYYAGAGAANELLHPVSGLKDFMRGYFYLKSADWPGNAPHPLKEWSAAELAKMPYYYVMPLEKGMRAAVQHELQRSGSSPDASESWLSDNDVDVYAAEFERTGFQGALNWYRVACSAALQRDLAVLVGKRFAPPLLNVLGTRDWGAYQIPGALEAMPATCVRFRGTRWIDGAGHFPHQEQPQAVVQAILECCAEKLNEDSVE